MSYRHRLRRAKRAMLCGLVRRYPALEPLLPAGAPLDVRRFGDPKHEELVVFLPGLGDLPDDFELNGFISALRDSARPADMMVADVHFGYYVRRNVLERLREDVIEPAKACGYREITLVGISLGGFGALLYTMQHPDDVQSLMLLAPYVGDRVLVDEIARPGGLRSWRSGEIGAEDFPRSMWRWLQQRALTSGSSKLDDIYLGFGDRDPFARGNALLAEVLPEHRAFSVAGGHDWPTWRRLWRMFLGHRDSSQDAASH